PDGCRMGDVVAVPVASGTGSEGGPGTVVWGRVAKIEVDPDRTAILARVKPLGSTGRSLDRSAALYPVASPVRPGTPVILPSAEAAQALIGTATPDEVGLRLGTLLGRPDVVVRLSAERLVSRHLAVVAM